VIVHIVTGRGNYISGNHIVATREPTDVQSAEAGSCFTTQVGALLATERRVTHEITAVLIAPAATHNTVLDSGCESQVSLDKSLNAFRATPEPVHPL